MLLFNYKIDGCMFLLDILLLCLYLHAPFMLYAWLYGEFCICSPFLIFVKEKNIDNLNLHNNVARYECIA